MTLDEMTAFPKAELHRHIDGSVPAPLLRRLGALVDDSKYKINRTQGPQELFAVFDTVLSVMQSAENIETVFYECTCDLAAENIWYAEWTFCPAYHTRGGLSYLEVFAAAENGIARAFADTGVFTKLIPTINREAWREEKPEDAFDPLGVKLAATAIYRHSCGGRIAGLGLACDEFNNPPGIYKTAFDMATANGILTTPHAGEMGLNREENIVTAINTLQATRIGHAIPAGRNASLLSSLIKHNVHVELNPLSNLICGFVENLDQLGISNYRSGTPNFSINSDDPVLLGASLSDNILAVSDILSWTKQDLRRLAINTLGAAGMNNLERAERLSFFETKLLEARVK